MQITQTELAPVRLWVQNLRGALREIDVRHVARAGILGLGVMMVQAGGCGLMKTAEAPAAPVVRVAAVGTPLALPPESLASHWHVPPYENPSDDAWGWEGSRNDARLAVGGSPKLDAVRSVEVYAVDNRWTQNGRVRESSYTRTRTLLRGSF